MSIYTLDFDVIKTSLTPPKLRKVKQLAWIGVLIKPLYILYYYSFIKYKEGSSYSAYSGATTYNFGDRVTYIDKSTYEATYTDPNGDPQSFIGVEPTSTLFWTKLNDVFIGADERVKYSAQKILFEYALNKFFMTSGIYITNNFVSSGVVFLMNNGSNQSSVMPLNSIYQIDYLNEGATYSTSSYDYTINFPIADYTALGTDADGIIRTFADNYNLAGMQYNIVTF